MMTALDYVRAARACDQRAYAMAAAGAMLLSALSLHSARLYRSKAVALRRREAPEGVKET